MFCNNVFFFSDRDKYNFWMISKTIIATKVSLKKLLRNNVAVKIKRFNFIEQYVYYQQLNHYTYF